MLTTLKYGIPFFYFTGKDFVLGDILFPIGVCDLNGHPKPLRQDLPMGSRVLDVPCSFNTVQVAQREQLLALLYNDCQLSSNYVAILES